MSYRNKQIAYGRWTKVTVDAEPVRQHIIALKSAGLGNRRISELSGVSRSAIGAILNGRVCRNQMPRTTVWRHTALKILAIQVEVDHVASGCNVDATGSIRRLRALHSIGWSQAEIARRIGWTPQNLNRYFITDPESIRLSTARSITALFNQLQLIPGPSQRSRNHARKLNWAPPLAWDEDTIDDPVAKPDRGEQKTLAFPERYAEMRELGYDDLEILRKWKVKPESLLRQLDRYKITASPRLVTLASALKHQKSAAS
jgi:transcriptional regulator with XRE-family HTH domain